MRVASPHRSAVVGRDASGSWEGSHSTIKAKPVRCSATSFKTTVALLFFLPGPMTLRKLEDDYKEAEKRGGGKFA